MNWASIIGLSPPLAPPTPALAGRPADAAEVGRRRGWRWELFIGTTWEFPSFWELPSFCRYGDWCSAAVLHIYTDSCIPWHQCGQLHYCYWPYYPTVRFPSPSSYTVSDEPFPDRSRSILCLLAQVGSCPITFQWLWPATDHEPHCRHIPTNKILRWTESTP